MLSKYETILQLNICLISSKRMAYHIAEVKFNEFSSKLNSVRGREDIKL